MLPLVRTTSENLLFRCYANAGFRIAYRGWSIYSTSLGGETPCYSSLLIPVSEPITALTSSNVQSAPTSTVIIVDQVFTYKFDLLQSASSGIGEAAKIGIGVGVGLGALLVLGLFLLIRHYRSRNPPSLPIPPPYTPRQAELDSVALQELHAAKGPGPRVELENTMSKPGP